MNNCHFKHTHKNPVFNKWGYQENNLNHPKGLSFRFIIQKQAVCIFSLVVLMAATTAQGQIKIDALGRVIAGNNALPYLDPDKEGKRQPTTVGLNWVLVILGHGGAWVGTSL